MSSEPTVVLDESSQELLDEMMTREEQQKLIEFIESIQTQLLELGESGALDIDWNTGTIEAIVSGESSPRLTWNLDVVLGKAH